MDNKKFNPEKYLIKVKGKDYLEVKFRLHWFRQEKPEWDIITELVRLNEEKGFAVVRADILDEQGKHRSSGIKTEYQKTFFDYVEKAETGAIGRALSSLGYGTLQCFDIDECLEPGKERICDSPVSLPQKQTAVNPPPTTVQNRTGDTRIITEKQYKRMFAIAKGNKAKIDGVMKKYGYTSSKDVQMKDYDNICSELEGVKLTPATATEDEGWPTDKDYADCFNTPEDGAPF